MGEIARTDIELVEASLRGEHDAFGHLVARYQDVVCAVSYSSTGDRVLGEDVAQETFIAAWRQLDRLRNSARLRPWLCGIARNIARVARKRRHRDPFTGDADEIVAPGPTPFEDAARGDAERVVRDALARIPETYREALVLYYREDQSIRDVAETLGISETAVEQRLSRGRRFLAESISDLVERSLRSERRQRDLVASVLAAIALIAIPSRVDASTKKGSTMYKHKLLIAASAAVVAGTTAYLVYSHHSSHDVATVEKAQPKPLLSYGAGQLGLAHAPSLGPTAAPLSLPSRNVAANDLAFLPADSDAVIGLNFAQVRQSALWGRFVAPLLLAKADELHAFQELCGFDPLQSLGTISAGLKGLGERDDSDVSGVVVIHGFDKTKARSCFDTHGVDSLKSEGGKAEIDGDVVLLTDPDNTTHWAFTFIDASTALVVIGPDAATKQGVERIAAGNSGLQSSTAYVDALHAIDTDDSLWLVIPGTSPVIKAINDGTEELHITKLGTVYVSMNVSDTLAVDAGLRFDSPATVAKLVSAIQSEMEKRNGDDLAKRFFDQLDVFADGSDLIISLAMTGDQIMQLGMSGVAQVSEN